MNTSTPMSATRSEQEELRRANEQLRQAILDKKQAQIAAWSAQIEQVQQSLNNVAESVRDETEKHLAELQQATQDSSTSLLEQSAPTAEVLRRFRPLSQAAQLLIAAGCAS